MGCPACGTPYDEGQRFCGLCGLALLDAPALAEISSDPSRLPDPPAVASSLAESLVLRAHVALGNEAALEPLRRAARALAAPGLVVGV
jgi:hypothetical protein